MRWWVLLRGKQVAEDVKQARRDELMSLIQDAQEAYSDSARDSESLTIHDNFVTQQTRKFDGTLSVAENDTVNNSGFKLNAIMIMTRISSTHWQA